jgi:flagellar biosynthesis/type III secretory pathway chaperone
MTHQPVGELVTQVSDAVSQLKHCLEQLDMKALELAIAQAQVAVDQLNAFPGGAEAVLAQINQHDSAERNTLIAKLEQARQDQDINAELIRLAMQRNAALQAHFAQQSDSATYSQEGGVPVSDPGKLLGRF